MLLSFDIDETLFYQHKHQEKLKLTKTVALQIIKHLINGDIILINTANTNKAKTAYIVADLLQTISLRDKQNKPLFDENAKEEFIKALNSNFYVSLAIGCEVYKLNVPSYEKLKTFDVLDQLLYSVKLTDCLYKKGISNEKMQRVKQILEDDEYFSQKIDMNRWGYLDYKCIRLPFPRGMVSIGYNEDLPTVSRPCIKKLRGLEQDSSYMKFIKKLEHERLSNLLKKNNIDDIEVAYVGNYDIFFAPTEASKETPIKILSEMYNLKPEECYSFGNEKVDILSSDIAKSFIMRGNGRHFSDYEVEKFSEKGVQFVDNLEEAICRVELNEMQKEKV